MDIGGTYGFGIVENGTCLWTSQNHKWTDFPDHEVFFHLDKKLTYSMNCKYCYSATLKDDCPCFSPIYFANNHDLRTDTFLRNIYEDLLGKKWNFESDVEFKRSPLYRAGLISYLKEKGFGAWLIPVNYSVFEMEICIFEPKKFLENFRISNTTDDIKNDCTQKIKCAPGKLFKFNKKNFLKLREKQITNTIKTNIEYGCTWTPYDHLIT
jgi:hypothetical protein